jgi:hypothetical protein
MTDEELKAIEADYELCRNGILNSHEQFSVNEVLDIIDSVPVPYLIAEVRKLRDEVEKFHAYFLIAEKAKQVLRDVGIGCLGVDIYETASLAAERIAQLTRQEWNAEMRERLAFEAGAERCAEANCSPGWYTHGAFDDWKRKETGDD